MIDPRKITPLLSNMSVEREIGRGPNGVVYLVSRRIDGKKLTLKHIPVPTSDAQTKALIFAGAVSSEADAQRYYNSLVKEIKAELLLLNNIKNASNLLKVRGYQVDQKLIGIGFDVYILADYCQPLPDYLSKHAITKLQAINLAIDLCTALEQLRSNGLIHKDVRPNNIYLSDSRHFIIGDLGLVKISELDYSSMPDHLLTDYTAPEVLSSDAALSETMDIYSVGMILYEIYNGGLLPTDSNGSFQRTDAELPAPVYADMTLSEIILRACAFDPEARYQSPSEMKQALILYLQRSSVTSDPLVPPPPPSEDDSSVDITTIAAAVEAGQVAEGVTDLLSNEPPAEDINPDFSEDQQDGQFAGFPIEDEAGPAHPSLNELSDDDLLLPTDGEISVEDFLASVRSAPGLEVVSMDSDGNTVTVPGYETEETLPEDTQYVDSADNRSADPDADNPETEVAVPSEHAVVSGDADENNVPEPADTDAATAGKLPAKADTNAATTKKALSKADLAEESPAGETSSDKPRRIKNRAKFRNDDVNVYDDGYEDSDEFEDEEYVQTSPWKKILISVIVLLVLAGGSFALYTFKTDTVQSMRSEVLSSSSVLIQADTKNDSSMEVVCSNAAGEIARVPYTEGGATFTDLNPSTTYTFTMKSTAGKFLLGSKQLDATTNQLTNLTGFAASSVSAVSANLALGGTGPQPEKWIVTLTSDSGEIVTAESSGTEIHVEGLKPETTYNATIARSDGDDLSGTTTCTFTTMGYTTLSSFETTQVDTDSISVQWAYTGTVPESWTVICEGTDGSSTSQEVNGTECTLDGLTQGVTYTLTLSCDSLEKTELNTLNVGIPTVTVTNITSTQNEDGNIEVSWDYTGDTTPAQWSVSYTYEAENEATPILVTSDTNSVVLENLVPDANYTIKVVGADEFSVGGSAETTCVTAEAEDYSNYGCSDANMSLYILEDNPDDLETPSTTFTSSEHIAFSIQVNYEASEEEKSAETLYVIRNSNNIPVYVYTSSRSWPGTWTTAKHTGNLPDMPQKPGSYTFEVYFDGGFLASAEFTVSG